MFYGNFNVLRYDVKSIYSPKNFLELSNVRMRVFFCVCLKRWTAPSFQQCSQMFVQEISGGGDDCWCSVWNKSHPASYGVVDEFWEIVKARCDGVKKEERR